MGGFLRPGRAHTQLSTAPRIPEPAPQARPRDPEDDLGERLCATGALDPDKLIRAETLARSGMSPLSMVLIQHGLAEERDVLAARAICDGRSLCDLDTDPPDPVLADRMSGEAAIALGAVPYREIGGALVIATHRTDSFAPLRQALAPQPVIFALAPRDQIDRAIGALYGEALAREAETRAPIHASCRVWSARDFVRLTGGALTLALLPMVIWPMATLALLIALAGAVYMANMALKIAAVAYGLRAQRDHEAAAKTDRVSRSGTIPLHPDPTITILVPLFEEREIAGALLDRIGRLDYPRDRLDVIFILEACDTTTQEALAAAKLPHWARAIIVPDGQPRTKPRALNYALPFARGTIIGIYDAEDCPEPDQLLAVTRRFSAAPPELACLQGQLDYYNATHNWISRCFTLEYASWFRLLLPGVARLGLIVPLGGTTLFLRKKALLDVGGWDAHNVTEDAELGLRLARAGYRTDLIATTTFEEANSELWPWIKQRSRWLKGYAITWATAMRRPRRLLRELGWKRFLGLQVQLGGTVIGFLTAPLIWSLAAIPLGLWHPLTPWIGPVAGQVLVWGFAASLAVTLSVAWMACRAPHLRALRSWLPALTLYFPLASAAMVVALSDLLWRPFHWVKTAHGHYSARNVDKSAVSAEASSLSRTSKARDRCETSSE